MSAGFYSNLSSAGPFTGSFVSDPLWIRNYFGYSIQAVVTDTGGASITGSLKLQVTNDNPIVGVGQVPKMVSGSLVNWSDLNAPAGSPSYVAVFSGSSALATGGPFIWDVTAGMYQWVRVSGTVVGGNGTIQLNAFVKSTANS